ncbi:MAG: MarR family winged helix-turn-helix transcriptional regulator [Acidimicrobiales bacterium]
MDGDASPAQVWPTLRAGRSGATRFPLPTLLSQALVAFTIELDNESEHQMEHRTTTGAASDSRRGPWLTSQAMWANFMQFIPEQGVPLRDVEGLARITNLAGLQRWRYVDLAPDPADERADPPRSDWLVRPTRAGRRAQEIWRPLASVIEERWRARFGEDVVGRLRESLQMFAGRSELELPQYLPVVAYAMFADIEKLKGAVAPAGSGVPATGADLSALLSQVLLMFTVEFERESRLSLPISANALRVLDETGTRVRDLPRLTGVSKEAIAMSVGFLERLGCVLVEPDPAGARGKVVRLTPKGHKAQEKYRRILGDTEDQWQARFGDDDVASLRAPLEQLVGDPAQPSPLLQGLQPYPEGWRASVRRPETLPHYPMVLHRGGYPDGS